TRRCSDLVVALLYARFFDTKKLFETKKHSEAFTATPQGVYYRGGLLEELDPATFKILWLEDPLEYRAIVKDKNAVYRFDFVRMFNAEGAEAKVSPWALAQRANFALIPDLLERAGERYPEADPNTFKIVWLESPRGQYGGQALFAHDKTHVYNGTNLIPGADPSTFIVLSECSFAKDAHHIYERERTIFPDLDPETFSCTNGSYGRFSKDARRVYFEYQLLDDFEAQTFEIIQPRYTYEKNKDGNPGMFLRDRDTIAALEWRGGSQQELVPIPIKDPATFVFHNDCYATDAYHVYRMPEGVVHVDANPKKFDPHRFEIEGGFCWYAPEMADLMTATLVTSTPDFDGTDIISKDTFHVFFNGEIIAEADPAEYEIISADAPWYGRDASSVFYLKERIPGLDPSQAVISGPSYIKDAHSVFYTVGEKSVVRVTDADPATFETVNASEGHEQYGILVDAKDKNHFYFLGKLVR
ncbi:MAG: DKNYY domain-containing protein, partial [Candidatus Margulisiibacteriota bacterium]